MATGRDVASLRRVKGCDGLSDEVAARIVAWRDRAVRRETREEVRAARLADARERVQQFCRRERIKREVEARAVQEEASARKGRGR